MKKEYYIKQDKYADFCTHYKDFGFNEHEDYYWKFLGNKRDLFVWKYNKKVEDLKIDYTTYDGYAYEGEFRHKTAYYAKALIEQGYIEVVNVR